MPFGPSMLHPISFLKDETGAVTADYVVLSAGLVAVAIAAASTVTNGVSDLSGEIQGLLADIDVMRAAVTTVAAFDFTGGIAPGWLGGQVLDMGGQMGELLVLGPGQMTGYSVQVPDGTSLATLTFDLVAGDSLDTSAQWGEDSVHVMINGVAVAIASNTHNQAIEIDIPQNDGTTVTAVVTSSNSNLGGRSGYTDAVTSVTIEVADPTQTLQFSVLSNANQGIQDEFWGIDNFQTDLTGGPGF